MSKQLTQNTNVEANTHKNCENKLTSRCRPLTYKILALPLIIMLLKTVLTYSLPEYKQSKQNQNQSSSSSLQYRVLQPVDHAYLKTNVLIGILSTGSSFTQRHLIRTSQIRPFNGSSFDITWKFVIVNPPFTYRKMIALEHETWGDVIVLSGPFPINSISLEFYKSIEREMSTFEYVAFMNSDTFLNVPNFLNEYLKDENRHLDLKIISRSSFKVISWSLMLKLNRLYESSPNNDLEEDSLLEHHNISYTRREITRNRLWTYKNSVIDFQSLSDVILINQLKDDDDKVSYLTIGGCFDSQGANLTKYENLLNDL
jgi:hypothetical protein